MRRRSIATLSVSDHALVRFLTRAGGFEIEAARTALATSLARAAEAAGKLDAAEYTIHADGLVYVVRAGVVVTVHERSSSAAVAPATDRSTPRSSSAAIARPKSDRV